MNLLFRQIWALVRKNLLLICVRRPIATFIRAFALPLVIVLLLAYSNNFFAGPQTWGVSSAHNVCCNRKIEARLTQTAGSNTCTRSGSCQGPRYCWLHRQWHDWWRCRRRHQLALHPGPRCGQDRQTIPYEFGSGARLPDQRQGFVKMLRSRHLLLQSEPGYQRL